MRKFWWTALTVAAFVGCGEESAPTDTTAPASPSTAPATGGAPSTPATTPATTPAEKDKGEGKEGKTETPPASAPPAIEAPTTTPKKDEGKKDEGKKDEGKKDEGKKDADKKASNDKLSTEELANVNKLPEADRILALKQVNCPVSDGHLGSMDAPVKTTVDGKTVFLCCKGCEKEVKANPKAVLAKLKD